MRCVASAHGCLRSLVQNPALNQLVGGVETVTVGDRRAQTMERQHGKFSKVVQQRAQNPIFETIVELTPEGVDSEWVVIQNVAEAVDKILMGQQYKVQVRRRCRETGEITVELGWH